MTAACFIYLPLGTSWALFELALEVIRLIEFRTSPRFELTYSIFHVVEAAWGADPLEAYGGFHSLAPDSKSRFASALGLNGHVGWSTCSTEVADHPLKSAFDITFPDIDWPHLQSVYGWAALQYQAWARGFLQVQGDEPLTVQIFTDGFLELRIDGEEFFGGDFYSFRRAPMMIRLAPGKHVVELRLVRDVRKDGAVAEIPSLSGIFEVSVLQPYLRLGSTGVIVPERVNGRLSSSLGSVLAHNAIGDWIEIIGIEATTDGTVKLPLSLSIVPLVLAPYQSRPVAFQFGELNCTSDNLKLSLQYKISTSNDLKFTNTIKVQLVSKGIYDPHKFTFKHPSGIISYAILRAPSNPKCSKSRLPILLALHGAGLDADSEEARHMLDAAYGVCAWTLIPTGGTAWSGDDWHIWGSTDINAAVGAIPVWIKNVDWSGPGVSQNDWIVVGHSNGGQGTWQILTHEPDKVIAAAPVSGYSSIENYVPFTMWHESDPMLEAVYRATRQNYKHEMLTDNFDGIQVLQQHGSADDNVPVYHSRLMHELAGPNRTIYRELRGEPHWRNDVLTTSHLLQFYEQHTANPVHRIPRDFSIVVPAAGLIGSRGGVMIDQLMSPHRLGRLDVMREEEGLTYWTITTQNIRSFHIKRSNALPFPNMVRLDGTIHSLEELAQQTSAVYFVKNKGMWTVGGSQELSHAEQRSGRQIGSLDAFLHSDGPFTIVLDKAAKLDTTAVQISRNFLQYYAADCQIVGAEHHARAISNATGNVLTIIEGQDCVHDIGGGFPVRIANGYIAISGRDEDSTASYHMAPGRFAVFLRPLPEQRLELLVWGANEEAARFASRLVPMLTGTGQPDFIIGDVSQLRLRGSGGVLAAGFFDWQWQVAKGSYITQ